MLRIDSTNTNYSASSIIGGNNVATFTASVNNPGDSVYFSINVNNLAILQTNLTEIKDDLADFIDSIAE